MRKKTDSKKKTELCKFKIGACILHVENLKVKGKTAEQEDFINVEHTSKNYACHDINATRIDDVVVIMNALQKYDLKPLEYREVQDKLIDEIGKYPSCGLCV